VHYLTALFVIVLLYQVPAISHGVKYQIQAVSDPMFWLPVYWSDDKGHLLAAAQGWQGPNPLIAFTPNTTASLQCLSSHSKLQVDSADSAFITQDQFDSN
jgi:hypothetical protein